MGRNYYVFAWFWYKTYEASFSAVNKAESGAIFMPNGRNENDGPYRTLHRRHRRDLQQGKKTSWR